MHISEGIRNMKEHESASLCGCDMTLCPSLRFGRKLKGYGRQEPGAKSVRIVYLATESVMGSASGNGGGRAEKPRYDVPQGVGVINQLEAELTNQRRGSGSKTQMYSAVPHGGAKYRRYTAFCRLP